MEARGGRERKGDVRGWLTKYQVTLGWWPSVMFLLFSLCVCFVSLKKSAFGNQKNRSFSMGDRYFLFNDGGETRANRGKVIITGAS